LLSDLEGRSLCWHHDSPVSEIELKFLPSKFVKNKNAKRLNLKTLDEFISEKANPEWVIYMKRLSANDTGATGGHQVGIYIPKITRDSLFPSINRVDCDNPNTEFSAKIVSHDIEEQTVKAVFYNSKLAKQQKKGRNESRITSWGGKQSPMQDAENTGSLLIFAFKKQNVIADCSYLEAWICRSVEEEDLLETITGEILPGVSVFGSGDSVFGGFTTVKENKTDKKFKIPDGWATTFPSGSEIISYLPSLFKFKSTSPDSLVIERRKAEFSLFLFIEEFHVLHKIKDGFNSVNEFIALANSVSNRRKSRAGKSLELHLEVIFRDNYLHDFSTQCVTEGNKKPDFIFPSGQAYHDVNYPEEKLRMLAVKTTCKDRWRQAINEADKIKKVHLFTLQEGVSVNQFNEMKQAGIILVVPKPLHEKFPKEIRMELITLEEFIDKTKAIYQK
jgi:hypothetical protein